MINNGTEPIDLAMQSFDALASTLWADADVALRSAEENPSGANKRAAFRAVFASIEGITSALKQQVLALWPHQRRHYTDAEVAILREERYDLDKHGEANVRPRVLPPNTNFRFAMTMFMRGLPTPLELDTSGDGWRSFQESLRIRNRVTHPRKPLDIEVTEKEIFQLKVAHSWAKSTVGRNMARALLEYRRREYAEWDVRLPVAAHQWLDSLESHLLAEGASHPIELSSHTGSENSNNFDLLNNCGLIHRDGSTVRLTQSGKDYSKWRRNRNL